jgi:hypothetical protein
MNLVAVYELRDRLETAVVAGVNLIQEDFRLKRAVEQMEPFAKVSPVFQKIYGMAGKLTMPVCEDRARVLLDTLGLLDAVLCTQGTSQVAGEILEPEMPKVGAGDIYKKLSYGRVAPVLEAFQGTGSGRYAVIRDAHEADLEIFEDYRMKYQMVKALGDSYGELADMVAEWLTHEKEQIIPLLKQGFIFDGKREMARRLQVMEKIAGNRENEFYRLAVRKGSKEVREAALLALRHDSSNLPLLLDSQKSEKGKCKEAAMRSLAYMDGEEAAGFWKEMMVKKPEETAAYLEASDQDWAGDLIADVLEKWIAKAPHKLEAEELPKGKETKEDRARERAKEREERDRYRQRLVGLWNGAVGKHSERILRCYELVYGILPKEVPSVLTRSLIRNFHPSFCQLAKKLYEKFGDEFLEPVFLASILTDSPEETYERFHEFIKPEGLLRKLTGKKQDATGVLYGFAKIVYQEEEGRYGLTLEEMNSPIRERKVCRWLPEGLDLRWYPLLLKYPGRFASGRRNSYSMYRNYYDWMIAKLYRPDVEELQKPYGEFFYEGALRLMPTTEGIQMMKRCKWKKYEGLLEACVKDNNSMPTYLIRTLLSELPMTNEELVKEIDKVIQGRKGKVMNGTNGITILEHWRDGLLSGVSVEKL